MTFAWLAFFDALLAITMILVGVIGAHFYLFRRSWGSSSSLWGFC